jgi:predicted transcriptional regulator
MLASVVFAFETTLPPFGLLPLLGGCSAAYLVATLLMRNSIMTEKIERRGIRAPAEYVADVLQRVHVRDIASPDVVSLRASDTLRKTRHWLSSDAKGTSHQGFPVLDARGTLVGVLTRRDLLSNTANEGKSLAELIQRSPKFVYDDCTVRQAADHMLNHDIGRLPVVRRGQAAEVIGMITRSDVLSVFRRHLDEDQPQRPTLRIRDRSRA